MEFFEYMPLMTKENVHTLIAGCMGSGKSVLLNGVICYIHTIEGSGLYLIDPKRVELVQYKDSDHTVAYASEPDEIISVIHSACEEMDRRFLDMQKRGLRKTDKPPRYVIIDELAQFSKRIDPRLAKANEDLARIATLGRASKIFIIACTQRPTNDVITPVIKTNCDCKIALRTASDQESRNIIQVSDAHYLPRWGQCIITHPNIIGSVVAPVRFYDDEEIEDFIYPFGHSKSGKRGFLQRLFG